MAHKVGQDHALHHPNTRSEVSLSPEAHDQDVDRTRRSEMVSGPVASAVEGPSCYLLPASGASCLEDSRYRCVEDTSCGGASRGEGHKAGEEVWRQGRGGTQDSCETDMVGGSASSFEAEQQQQQQQQGLGAAAAAVMEHADPNLYTSDEWEESDLSDTEGDHSDSSDDDDPKSQVDRLIEQVTLVYLDGENSNLSSESSDDSDYDDSDSESDITDVSPLISATASPLGLSPVLPRRTLGTSPLALHDNRDLGFDYGAGVASVHHGFDLTVPAMTSERHSFTSQDPSDMTVLLKAVVELEEEQRREQGSKRSGRKATPSQAITPHPASESHQPRRSPPIAIHPIDASPHHRHLRRAAGHHHRRKNMSFPNEEVRRIDRDNQILLEKIMSTHTRTSTKHHHHSYHHSHHHSSHSHSNSHSHNHSTSSSSASNPSYAGHHTSHHNHHPSRPVHRPANSTINRRREEEKIRRENMILLRKIQEAKPSREVAAFRSARHHHHHRTPPGSCGASARTAPGHVAAATTRRKETAL